MTSLKLPRSKPLSQYLPNWRQRLKVERPKVVCVSWLDACSHFNPNFSVYDADWPETAELGVVNQTVGWLLSVDSSWVIVAGELDDAGHPRDISHVPTAIVLNVDVLVPGDADGTNS